jgi:hypothetical protein
VLILLCFRGSFKLELGVTGVILNLATLGFGLDSMHDLPPF